MSSILNRQNLKKDVLAGLTGAMLLGSYALCTAASAGLGLWNVFFCVVICSLFSAKLKNKIYAPDVFLLIPVHYVVSECGNYYLPICIVGGVIIYYLLSRIIKINSRINSIIAWVTLLLALVATVILTNQYFGIGASGSTAIEMLKSYRSLGFHPLFRGLLYGTITLFAMITYPFKFRKLNKKLPAEFMTLLIPLVLNLFLNPEKELTTINEIDTFKIPFDFPKAIEEANTLPIILGCLYFGFILFLRSSEKNISRNTLANMASGILSFLPARQFDITNYSLISAVVTIVVSGTIILLCPNILARIPMHCVGALLIVSAWQQVPYKNLSLLFKKADKGAKE
ncbi:MAG: hypothetical protein E7529_04715 [Ruminococcaceae bacterium]|nr:hypothetical protein [Oscillospiraceae bacterium]